MKTFKQKVLDNVNKIPYGKVTTYQTIALLSDSPRSSRQVGWILRRYGEDIPWWRVINSKGYISIKNPEISKNIQKDLLIKEGIIVSKDFKIDLSKYGW